jgi:transcriptional regulator with XRE-family HTH domain
MDCGLTSQKENLMYSNLKLQIWKTGIHQNRLAKMLQMDETILSRIVNGYREPSAELRGNIARLLSCDEAWLFEEAEPAPATPPAKARKLVVD